MRLNSLHLFNFQGIRDARFDFGGHNASIYGNNGTGKTTICNAITWLLFNKPSTDKAKNFTPKTNGPDGEALHYLDHGVEADFTLEDGRRLTLKKVFVETYKRKRGSAVEEFTGHEISYYVDGVPFKEKEYLATLENLIGSPELMKILLMPYYFAEKLPWEQRRKILLDMCGDITDEDVIAENPDLGGLKGYLLMPGTEDKFYTVDEYKKIAISKMRDVNKELQGIPARIDEAQKAMPNTSNLNAEIIQKEIGLTTAAISETEQVKGQMFNSSESEAKTRQIAALQNTLASARAEHTTAQAKQNEGIYKDINEVQAELADLTNKLYSLENYTLKGKIHEIEQMDTRREELLMEYAKVSEGVWNGDEICPTCNQALPDDEVERAKEAFNLAKSKRLEEINKDGQTTCSKNMIEALDIEIKAFLKQIAGLKSEIEVKNTVLSNLKGKITAETPFETTPKYLEITAQIKALEETGTNELLEGQIAELDSKIKEYRNNLDRLLADKSKLALAKQQEQRIEQLSAQEKQLAKEYESLQAGVYLCEEFIKAKVSMITDNINSKFETVRFRLFVEQINGGIKEDCEVMVPSKNSLDPFSSGANEAACVNAGLEIINVLGSYYNKRLPVFVDKSESITELLKIESQVIRLEVSKKDKELRLEIEAGRSASAELLA